MTLELYRQDLALTFLVCAVGIGASWMTQTPYGLLAPMAAFFRHARGRAVTALFAVLAIAFVGASTAALFGDAGSRDARLTLAAFFALAFCIGALCVDASPSEAGDATQAIRIIRCMPAHTWSASPDGTVTYVSASMVAHIGEPPRRAALFHELDNAGWRRAIHPDDYHGVIETRRRSLETGDDFDAECRIRNREGDYRWFRIFGAAASDDRGTVAGWYGTIVDIEERRRVADALRKSERQLQQLIDTVPALMWSATGEGKPTYVNKPFTKVTGATVEDIIDEDGKPDIRVIHPDYKAAAEQALARSIKTGEPYLQRYLQLRADGSYRWTETRAEPLRDEAGSIIQWYGVSTDIHDLVTAQAALHDRQRELDRLIETLPALIFCAKPDGRPIYRSRQLREFLGFDVDEIDEAGRSRLESTLDSVIHPDDLSVVRDRYGSALATGELYACRHRLRRFDGEYRWVETRAAPMRGDDGEIVQWNGVCFEIDEQVRAQEELNIAQERLARSSQAASLAELSASIAHEVNQPLAAIVANSHASRRWLAAEPPNIERAQTTIDRITRDANAAADVVSRIRALFRQSTEARGMVPLNAVLMEARELIAEEALRRRVRVEVDLAVDLPSIALDRVQIQQVMVNLVRNGMDAMESVEGERVLRIGARRCGDEVRVEVNDTGPESELPYLMFEPFFSTKGHGMGMGLAICRSMVEAHGGRLWAERHEPRGASFIFTLPLETTAAR